VALSLIFSVAVITLLVGQQPTLSHLLNTLTQSWSDAARLVVATIVGYLLGAIPFGFIIVGFLRERDITSEGSGRTGGTNAMRAAGFGAGALTVVGDVAKGIAAVYAARELAPGMLWAEVVAGWGAVLGHNASLFLMFRGGAGSGPNMGAAGALWGPSLIFTLACLPFSLFVIGYASVGSLLIAVVIIVIFALRAILGHGPVEYVWYGVGTLLLVAYALRPNIERLLKGQEKRVGLPGRRQRQHPGSANISE
jgi:glycerol-3-phosphate acyltransferase PlsY